MTLLALLLFEIFQLEFPRQNRKQPEVQPDHPPGIRRFRVDILNMYDRRFRLYFDQFAVGLFRELEPVRFDSILDNFNQHIAASISEFHLRGWANVRNGGARMG